MFWNSYVQPATQTSCAAQLKVFIVVYMQYNDNLS